MIVEGFPLSDPVRVALATLAAAMMERDARLARQSGRVIAKCEIHFDVKDGTPRPSGVVMTGWETQD